MVILEWAPSLWLDTKSQEWKEKQQHFFQHGSTASRSLMLNSCSKEEDCRRRDPLWPTSNCPGSAPGQILPEKTRTLVRDHEYFIPTKFHQNPSNSVAEEVELDMCLWNTDAPGGNKVQLWQKSLSPTFWPCPAPQGRVMSVKCEQPLDELTVQVW